MITIEHTIQDELGLHARPAGQLVKLATGFKSDINLSFGDKTVSAKKLFQVMGLGTKGGSKILVTISGEDEREAAEAIQGYLTAYI